MQTLAYKKPWLIPYDNEAVTVPPFNLFTSSVTLVVVAGKIRYQLSGITETEFNLLNDSLYLFIQDEATNQTGDARAITYLEKIEGTPDTFFVVISEPFTVGAGTYIVRYVDPQDWEPSISVEVTEGNVAFGGGDSILAGNVRNFLATKPQEPVVLTPSGGVFRMTNTTINNITVS